MCPKPIIINYTSVIKVSTKEYDKQNSALHKWIEFKELNLFNCCEVPQRRNSVLNGFTRSLFSSKRLNLFKDDNSELDEEDSSKEMKS